MTNSIQQILPVSIMILWVLATIRFKFIQRGHIIEWIAITAIASYTTLAYIGYPQYATITSALFMVSILYHSVQNTDKEDSSVLIVFRMYNKVYSWLQNKRK